MYNEKNCANSYCINMEMMKTVHDENGEFYNAAGVEISSGTEMNSTYNSIP